MNKLKANEILVPIMPKQSPVVFAKLEFYARWPDTGDPVEQFWGIDMRKGALLLAIVMAASAPTAAFAAKKKAKAPAAPAKYSTTPANSNESSARVVRDGFMQIFVPFQSMAATK